jgi:hypothetical protein
MDPSPPTGLANRVQMNARLYFCRRANENMESMTKDTFVIRIHSVTGRRYVVVIVFWGPNEGDRKRTYIPRLFLEYMLTFRVE